MSPSTLTGYLTVNEAAEYTRMHRATIYRAVAANRIPYVRDPFTGRLRFKISELDDWMHGRKP